MPDAVIVLLDVWEVTAKGVLNGAPIAIPVRVPARDGAEARRLARRYVGKHLGLEALGTFLFVNPINLTEIGGMGPVPVRLDSLPEESAP